MSTSDQYNSALMLLFLMPLIHVIGHTNTSTNPKQQHVIFSRASDTCTLTGPLLLLLPSLNIQLQAATALLIPQHDMHDDPRSIWPYAHEKFNRPTCLHAAPARVNAHATLRQVLLLQASRSGPHLKIRPSYWILTIYMVVSFTDFTGTFPLLLLVMIHWLLHWVMTICSIVIQGDLLASGFDLRPQF